MVLIIGRKYPKCPKIHLPNLSAQAQKFGILMKKGFIGRPFLSNKSRNNHYYIFLLGITPFFIRKIKPKIMFLYSEIVFTISMLAFAIFALLVKEYPGFINLDFFSWIPMALMIICMIASSAGIMPVIQTLLAESYPTEIR